MEFSAGIYAALEKPDGAAVVAAQWRSQFMLQRNNSWRSLFMPHCGNLFLCESRMIFATFPITETVNSGMNSTFGA